MGFLDGGFLGGMFDVNGDGKVDIGEEYLAYKVFEEVTREDNEEEDDDFWNDDDGDDFDDYGDDDSTW